MEKKTTLDYVWFGRPWGDNILTKNFLIFSQSPKYLFWYFENEFKYYKIHKDKNSKINH